MADRDRMWRGTTVPAIRATARTSREPWCLRGNPVVSCGTRDKRNFPSGCHLQPRDLRNKHSTCSADRGSGESQGDYRSMMPNIESFSVTGARPLTRRDEARRTNADLLGQIFQDIDNHLPAQIIACSSSLSRCPVNVGHWRNGRSSAVQ
jgi:hypothetical protein